MFLEEVTFPGGTRVLVWRLEEETSLLASCCHEMGIAFEDLMDLPLKRQREKAAERLLLCRAFGHPVTLSHDEQGAPSVEGHEQVNISITHTPQLVALAVNENEVIGLDAEQADRQQVLKVRAKIEKLDQKTLVIRELPFTKTVSTLCESITKAIEKGKIKARRVDDLTSARMTTHRVERHYMTLAIAY